MKKQKISPAQLAQNKLQARRLMEHMDRVTPGGLPPMVGPFRGIVSTVARVWGILIVALLLTTLGFQVSKSTAEAAPAPESTIKTLELPL